MRAGLLCLAAALCVWAPSAAAWDQLQLEVFDAVEEVDQNFYQLLNISQEADLAQVKSAFRALSRVLHPDKNAAADADVQFRRLVSAYDVLRDPAKRAHYDDVLVNGLPNWRSAVYYYRHYRKMGMTEMCVILVVLLTVGHYLIGWAAYLESRFTHQQVHQAKLEKRRKKLNKKGLAADEQPEEEPFELGRPSLLDTLPVLVPRLVCRWLSGVPAAVRRLRQARLDAELSRRLQLQLEQERRQLELQLEQKRLRDKELRRRRQAAFRPAERPDLEQEAVDRQEVAAERQVAADRQAAVSPPPPSGGLWTDDDLGELVSLSRRYPGGTQGRWERIAEHMGRSVAEVTYMAARLKDSRPSVSAAPGAGTEEETGRGKVKTRKAEAAAGAGAEWTQTQQRALEAALARHPKGPADRWDKIARCVPDKSKEECMLRYRHLVQLLRNKKDEPPSEPPHTNITNKI